MSSSIGLKSIFPHVQRICVVWSILCVGLGVLNTRCVACRRCTLHQYSCIIRTCCFLSTKRMVLFEALSSWSSASYSPSSRFGSISNISVGFTRHDDRMCRNCKGTLLPLANAVCDCVMRSAVFCFRRAYHPTLCVCLTKLHKLLRSTGRAWLH